MSELAFAKQFIATVNSRPSKIYPDHVEDPRRYPARSAYILPKMEKPLAKRQKLAPGAERSLTITLKSLRNPPLDITLKSQSLNTSILSLKEEITSQTSIPISKIKILHNKKPLPDSKVLKDLVNDEEVKVEFSVMVLGGAATVKKRDEEVIPPVAPPAAQGVSGIESLRTEQFWVDLKGFLVQRLRDQSEGEKVYGVFRKAWDQDQK